MKKLSYFARCLLKSVFGPSPICPSCGGEEASLVDSKWAVTSLRRCGNCKLLYRTPITSDIENQSYYQLQYIQGFTTELPDDTALAYMLKNGFDCIGKDFRRCIEYLEALGTPAGSRLLDFGSSWGYGSRQFADAGYRVESMEISESRGDYARSRMGMTVFSDPAEIPSLSYDVFFSSHVIEHVPSVKNMLATAERVLVPGGLFVALTPNGSDGFRFAFPNAWHQLWGEVHPQLIDQKYVQHNFKDRGWLLDSTPVDTTAWPARLFAEQTILKMDGVELLLAYRTPIKLPNPIPSEKEHQRKPYN